MEKSLRKNLLQEVCNNLPVELNNYKIHLERILDDEKESYSFLKLCLQEKLVEIFYRLIELGASLKGLDEPGEATILHHATSCRIKPDCLDMILLENNNNINAVNRNNETAIHVAAKMKNWIITDKLLDYLMKFTTEHCNMVDNDGLSILHILCMRGNLSYVTRFLQDIPAIDIHDTVLLKSEFWPGYSTIHFAAAYYRYEIIKILMKHGAYLNTKTLEGFTLLHILCKINKNHWIFGKGEKSNFVYNPQYSFSSSEDQSSLKFLRNILENRYKSVELLLQKNINVHAVDKNGNHVLLHVASNNYPELKDEFNSIKLDNHSILRIVLKVIADSQLQIMKLLLEHCNVIKSAKLHLCKFNVSRKLKELNLVNNIGYTVLHELAAISCTTSNVLSDFLECGVDVNAVDKYYVTPLHIATEKRNINYIKTILKFDYKNDWEQIVNVNAQDNFGNTPLRSILYTKNIHCRKQSFCFEKILKFGADIFLENEGGTSIFSTINNYVLKNLSNSKTNLVFSDQKIESISKQSIYEVLKILVKLRQCGSYNTELYNNFIAANISERTSLMVTRIESECANEVEKMKNIKISSYATLCDVLTTNINRIAFFTKNDVLKNVLETPDFKKNFPQYGSMLRARFIRGTVRRKLLDEAKNSLRLLMQSNIPDLCLVEVLNYLNENKLRDVIESVKTVKEKRKI